MPFVTSKRVNVDFVSVNDAVDDPKKNLIYK